MGRRSRLDAVLLAATVVAVLCAALSWLPVPLRALGALPLALVLPGYWLTAALLPTPALGAASRAALSVGFSIVLCVLAGLLLNLTSGGLSSTAWVLTMGGVTLLGSAAGWLRGGRRLDERSAPAIRSQLPGRRQSTLLGLAAVLLLGAFGLARFSAVQHNQPDFTQLWMVPDAASAGRVIQLGLRNQERAAQTFALELRVDGEIVNEWRPIRLAPQQTWQAQVVAPDGHPFAGTVEALLYRTDAPGQVYRHVLLRPAA